MNELAVQLNAMLEDSCAYPFLSEVGKRMYFPKGIVAQSDEAKEKAKRYNATVGLATSHGEPFYLSDIYSSFKDGVFKPSQIFSYAPGGGDKELRALWKADMEAKNPSLKGKKTSTPIVTGGLTHTISLIAQLFVSPGDEVVCPDLFWDNYDLIFTDLAGARLKLFRFYDENGHFNVGGMKEALMGTCGSTARIILNFPNNPTGYTPSKEEALAIVEAIKSVADTGKKVLVISDDAYFGYVTVYYLFRFACGYLAVCLYDDRARRGIENIVRRILRRFFVVYLRHYFALLFVRLRAARRYREVFPVADHNGAEEYYHKERHGERHVQIALFNASEIALYGEIAVGVDELFH